MTLEERAEKCLIEIGGIAPDEWVMRVIVSALRDQIEDCAKVLDGKAEHWKRCMKTIKHFTGTYEEVELIEEMASEIRALAGQTDQTEGKEVER